MVLTVNGGSELKVTFIKMSENLTKHVFVVLIFSVT